MQTKGKDMINWDKLKIGDKVKCVGVDAPCYRKFYSLGDILEVVPNPLGGKWLSNPKTNYNNLSGCYGEFELITDQPYEVGKWHIWKGGECPLPEGTKFECYKLSSYLGVIRDSCASEGCWEHEEGYTKLVAFRVTSYPKKTKTVELELTEDQHEAVKEVLKQME